MDESGHDHREMPYEVRGGIAIHASKLWPFVQQIQRLEYSSYGAVLSEFRSELKGSKLLDKDRFAWSLQSGRLGDDERRKHCRSFLTKGLEKKAPIQVEFTAYGQASLEMARGLFQLLHQHDARLFAAAIPRGVQPPANYQAEDYLRKDQVFLLERFFTSWNRSASTDCSSWIRWRKRLIVDLFDACITIFRIRRREGTDQSGSSLPPFSYRQT